MRKTARTDAKVFGFSDRQMNISGRHCQDGCAEQRFGLGVRRRGEAGFADGLGDIAFALAAAGSAIEIGMHVVPAFGAGADGLVDFFLGDSVAVTNVHGW